MKRIALLALIVCGFSSSAYAETVQCDIYAGLNRYHYDVELDTESQKLTVTTDDGYVYSGSTTYSKSGRTGDQFYHLKVSYTSSLEFWMEASPTRNWLCLQENQCYVCD